MIRLAWAIDAVGVFTVNEPEEILGPPQINRRRRRPPSYFHLLDPAIEQSTVQRWWRAWRLRMPFSAHVDVLCLDQAYHRIYVHAEPVIEGGRFAGFAGFISMRDELVRDRPGPIRGLTEAREDRRK